MSAPSSPTSWRAIVARVLPVLLWMGLIYTLSDRSTLPHTPGLTAEMQAILGHFTVYGVLAVLFWWSFGGLDVSAGRRLALAFAAAMLYAFSDEWHQSFVPGRDSSWFDIMVDAIGATCGLTVLTVLRRRFGHTTPDRAGAD